VTRVEKKIIISFPIIKNSASRKAGAVVRNKFFFPVFGGGSFLCICPTVQRKAHCTCKYKWLRSCECRRQRNEDIGGAKEKNCREKHRMELDGNLLSGSLRSRKHGCLYGRDKYRSLCFVCF
jgi:hypothetical protein